MNKFILQAFAYDEENHLVRTKLFDKRPTKEDVERFIVDFFDHNQSGKLTQEDLDFISYDILHDGYTKSMELYYFVLTDLSDC